ncbi:MAG: DUF11 domain-containing protein [Anaerolineae bacterium]|nr:DUF11 domain-containing protein [Anaerolineae bacterium]
MTAERQQTRSRWLFGVAALVLIAIAIVALGGHVAASPGAPAAVAPRTEGSSPRALAPDEPAYTPVSTITLPYVVKNLSVGQLEVEKAALPTSFISRPGRVVTYTVTVANVGAGTGTLLSIVDTLPAGFYFDSMAPGSDVVTPPDATSGTITWAGSWNVPPGTEITLVYRVTTGQAPGQYTNQVYIAASGATVPAEPAHATVTIQSSVLMTENFDAGIGAWTPFLNHHRLAPGQWYFGHDHGTGGSGALTHDCSLGTEVASDGLMMYLQPGAQEWTDYRVEADMLLTGGMSKEWVPQPTQGDPIGFWIRGHYQDSENESQWVSGYYVVIVGQSDSTSHRVKISKMQNPDDCDACEKPYRMYNFDNPLDRAWSEAIPGPFEHYRWYHLAVEVRGNNIKVFMENDLVIDWTDPVDKGPYLSGTIGFKTHETMTARFDNVTVTALESSE